MNEAEFAHKIRDRLDEGLDLRPDRSERLRTARERALARQRLGAPVAAVVARRGGTALLGGPGAVLTRIILPAVIVLAALFGYNEWQQAQREALLQIDPQAAETADIDAGLLTSDLPIDAYLDKGFQAWLQAPADFDEASPQSE